MRIPTKALEALPIGNPTISPPKGGGLGGRDRELNLWLIGQALSKPKPKTPPPPKGGGLGGRKGVRDDYGGRKQ